MHEGAVEYVYVAERWEGALDHSGAALKMLREIYPEYNWVGTETGNRAIESAIRGLQEVVADLHRAGRHVLGAEQYDRFVEERVDRVLGVNEREGDYG